MKGFSFALIFVGLATSAGAYAALPTGAGPFQVSVPNITPGFEFNITGLYLKPTQNHIDYATQITGGVPANTTILSVKPDYNLGFKLGIGYVFPGSGNDVRLSWTHFNQGGNAPMSITETSTATQTTVYRGGSTNNKYNAIDLDAGQFVDIGTHLQVRVFGGLRYAKIESDFTQSLVYTSPGLKFDVNTLDVAKFSGIGPRFGLDTAYHLGNCFGLVGHVAGSVLAGRLDASQFSSSKVLNNSKVTSTSTSDGVAIVVPGIDASLGLDYSYPFNADSVFSIELGYQMTHYVDAITYVGTPRSFDSVGFNGPYLSLNLKV